MTAPSEAGPWGDSPPVRLVVSSLDEPALDALRTQLRASVSQPHTVVEIDLEGQGQRHQITLFALLTATARRGKVTHCQLRVLNPPQSMSTMLSAAGLWAAPLIHPPLAVLTDD